MRLIPALILIVLALAGCSNQGLRDLRNSSSGPDEFIVEPKARLQTPTSYASLPSPMPGQGNLADTDPLADAAQALGGRKQSGGAADGALIAATGRFGVDPEIRTLLADADADFRRRKGRFTQYRITSVGLYERLYKSQSLDAYAEARRWQRAGIAVPSFPPQ